MAVVGGWPGRERLRGRVPLAGRVPLGHRAFLERPDRLAGFAVEHVEKRLLGRLRERFHRAAVDGDVGENRGARNVHVPHPVMHQLVVPLAHASLHVHRDDALGEEVVPGTFAAVVVVCRQFNRQIRQAQLWIGGDLTPGARVPGVGP